MPSGHRYEDAYGKYLEVFKLVAESDYIEIHRAPYCWHNLLMYLGANVISYQEFFPADKIVDAISYRVRTNISRLNVEALACYRPELVDALWKSDVEWDTIRRKDEKLEKEFPITSSSSFNRPEVLNYMKKLWDYKPEKKNVVLVPCAADKPYPSKLHQAVLDRMPDDFYLMNATGVIGLVPQDLWDDMPHYDSGIPNEWRLMQIASRYFSIHEHDTIICYTDYYNLAIDHGLTSIGRDDAIFINPVKFHYNYTDLLAKENLKKLEYAFKERSNKNNPNADNYWYNMDGASDSYLW